MKKLAIILILPFMLAGSFELLPSLPDISSTAEAARIGGGRSIGSRPSYNRSAPAPSQTRPGMQQAAPSYGTGLGGMFGPMLAGGLLGALFFGGAFTGLRLVDIVIIIFMVMMVSRLLRSRRVATEQAGSRASGQRGNDYSDAWAHLRDNSGASAGTSYAGSNFTPPPGFEREKFMEGARLMYSRMQSSWDKRDLEDIRQFTTPGMFKIIEEQAKEDPAPSATVILTMQAQPHEFKHEGGEEIISVYFDVLMREYADREAENAREIWHFARPAAGGSWKLDGIQQVD